MYETFFGLHSKPFDILPNPDFLYLSKSHKRAVTYLDYGIKARSGFILVTGEIGSGKTTIIRDLIKKKLDRVVLSKVFNTKVSSEQLISMINDDFGLPVEGKDKIALLRDLNEFLIQQFAHDMQPVLIIDEAQNLSSELLEEVRMLSNLETDQAKLLQIILVGQPELKKILTSPEMLQLRQRITINCHIQPLTLEETEQYILHRLEKVGDRHAARFAPDALELIHAQSRGVPRLINIICDFLMLSMFSAETREIDGPTTDEVLKELDFEQQFWETEAGSDADQDSATTTDLQRTKVKLSNLLRDINQRIEILERHAANQGESVMLDLASRVETLENIMNGYGRDIAELRNQQTACPDELLELLHQEPPKEAVEEPDREQTEGQEASPRRGFFRRLFRS